MNFLWLEDIVALAAHGGFSRAAEARHVTQPAFSRRIRALEDWLGVALVDRGRQPIALTEAGSWFAGVARDEIARVARFPADARAMADARAATLRFAATHALSLSFVPEWLRHLEDRLPSPVSLLSDVLARGEEAMLARRVDFLVCHAHPDVPGRLDGRFRSAPIGSDVLVPVSAPSSRAAARGGRRREAAPRFALDAASPGTVPMLAFSGESGLGRIVAALRGAALAKAGARTVFTAHLATVLRGMALDGRGVAWLPKSLVDDDLRTRRLVAAAPAAWRIAIEIRLFRADVADSPAIEAFWSAATGPVERR